MSKQPVMLASGVHWVGAKNPKLRVFDIIMRTEQGTTYNAYLVQGTEKSALIETVKSGHAEELFERVGQVMPLERIDYLVLNHLEPDHSGSVPAVLERMPRAKVVVSKNGKVFLQELLNRDLDPLTVGTGDRLDLGGKTLEFITAPFLHWPDTMMTYVPEDQVLFSCDVGGCHYCAENVWEDPRQDISHAFRYYFDVIMRPFKEYVRKGLNALEGKPIRILAPSHGPVRRETAAQALDSYREWSAPMPAASAGGLVVVYASAYGLTGQLAEAVAEGARAAGAVTSLYDLTGVEAADLVGPIEQADGLAVGSTTINGDAVQPVWTLLASLATLRLKGKWGGAFGSYGWSGEAVPMIEERLKGLKFRLAVPGLRVRFTPTPADLETARSWGRTLAGALRPAAVVAAKG